MVQKPRRIVFITGTDTGVGKTLLTSLLVLHSRDAGVQTLALKPFCSGGSEDTEVLHALQKGALTRDEITLYSYPEPLAPLVCARLSGGVVDLGRVEEHVLRMSERCDLLLVEGAGGLLTPLAEGTAILDLIEGLGCRVVVAARNRLGTINHSLLTLRALHQAGICGSKLVLMGGDFEDASVRSNAAVLSEFVNQQVFTIEQLPGERLLADRLEDVAKILQKTLADILS